MIKIFYLVLFLVFLEACSFQSKSSFWTSEKKIAQENKNLKIYKLSKEDKELTKEFNKNIKLNLNTNPSNNSFVNNLNNNNGMINFDGPLTKSSKYKFSKIENFDKFETDLIFHEKGLIFFDNLYTTGSAKTARTTATNKSNTKVLTFRKIIKYCCATFI